MIDLSHQRFERVLIIKPSSPGDIIHALPVSRALRSAWPHAHISWLIGSSFVNMLEAESSINALIPFDRKHYGRTLRSWSATRDFVKFLGDLRQRRFDLVLDLQGLIRSGFMSIASGARRRVGFRGAREGAWLFYNTRLPVGELERHAAQRNADILKPFHIVPDAAAQQITYTPQDALSANALRAAHGMAADEPYVVLVPSTRWETKRWPLENYAKLASRIRDELGIRPLLVGTPGERADAETVAGGSRHAAVNLCGQTTLRQLAATIAGATAVVTSDSTPMHMAAAYDRPLVAFFGPTSAIRTGPYRHTDQVVRLELECSPCYLRNARDCPHGLKCMKELSVEMAFAALRDRLQLT